MLQVYEKLPDHQRFHLRNEKNDIYLADGHKAQTCGTGETAVRLGNQELTFSVVVANVDDDAILGMDFLSQTNATLDIVQGTIIVNGEIIDCFDCPRCHD